MPMQIDNFVVMATILTFLKTNPFLYRSQIDPTVNHYYKNESLNKDNLICKARVEGNGREGKQIRDVEGD